MHTGDGAVATLAARQCGVVTTEQLASAGSGGEGSLTVWHTAA